MKFEPHKYQRECINRLINDEHVGLFLDMGLGKTVITLTAINELIYHQHKVNRVLIIAPKKVAESTWSEEAKKWDHLKHLRFSKILGNQKKRLEALESDADIYIINRENVKWLIENSEWRWDCVVIDELSSFKSSKSKRFKALVRRLGEIKRLYGLTGTPIGNGYEDLWAEIYLLDSGERLGKRLKVYHNRYFNPVQYPTFTTYALKKGVEGEIQERIKDICISLKASDHIGLPARVDTDVIVELPPGARRQYDTMEKDSIIGVDFETVTAASAASRANKLLQLSSGCIYDEEHKAHSVHTAKLEALGEIIEAAGEPVLVFYQYQFERDAILKTFDKARQLTGESEIREWNEGKIPILIAHPESCGYGLNLQDGGHIIVWYSPTYNYEQYEQANARLLRQGQDKPVMINHILAANTLDSKVMQALKNKGKTADILQAALKARVGEINVPERYSQ